jgi:glycosyltransferase involved in cell wall biosynthesis
MLADDNQLLLEKFVLVPNAPLGPARRNPSGYWHERFGLSPDHRIVLHAGSLAAWTGIEDITSSVKSWPENWVLVVHTRHDAESSMEVKRLYKLAVPGRVFFSLKPVCRQEYDMLVDGADIGVAFLMPKSGSRYTQRNIQAIGLSSGKISYYLRSGLPVIVNTSSSISELVRRERCGICVEEGRNIGEAIAQIAKGYQRHSERARMVFDNYLDFACSFREVIRRIDSMERRNV